MAAKKMTTNVKIKALVAGNWKMNGLKTSAKELGIPVMALSHVEWFPDAALLVFGHT